MTDYLNAHYSPMHPADVVGIGAELQGSRGGTMRTIEFEIIDFHSAEEAEMLQRRMRETKGVAEASVRFPPGTLIVNYDQNRTTPAELETAVLDCREHCKGSLVIGHICVQPERN